jgi:DNA-binding NarL/FixJ family response regulator
MSIRVVLADDHQLVCEGLEMLLESQPGTEVVGVAHDGREAVRMARELDPDVVIMDVAMPGLNGIDATRQLLAESPRVKVIALSMHADKRYVTGMLSAGVSGYLLKDCAGEELVQALQTVVGGQVYLSPSIAGVVVAELAAPAAARPAGSPLSPREREVLQLLAEGHNSRESAAILHLSVKTVESHRRQIMTKLGLDSVADLTKYAVREGITTLDDRRR